MLVNICICWVLGCVFIDCIGVDWVVMLSLLLVVLVIGWCILLWLFWDYYVCCDFNDYLVYLGVIGYWVLVCVDLEWVYVFCDGELVVDYEWIWVVY